MRKIIAKARPSKYVFCDLYGDQPLRCPHYYCVDFCTVSRLNLYLEDNPNLVVVSKDGLHNFVMNNDVDFMGGFLISIGDEYGK